MSDVMVVHFLHFQALIRPFQMHSSFLFPFWVHNHTTTALVAQQQGTPVGGEEVACKPLDLWGEILYLWTQDFDQDLWPFKSFEFSFPWPMPVEHMFGFLEKKQIPLVKTC